MDTPNLKRIANKFLTANALLLMLLIITIFGVTLFPASWYSAAYIILFNLILICVIFCLDRSYRAFSNITVVVLVIIFNLAFFSGVIVLNEISDSLNGLFFVFTVYRLLTQVAKSKMVTTNVIIESVCGYLLLGLVFSMAIARVEAYRPGSFSFPVTESGPMISRFYDSLYYGFITMGTVGYGDIVPKTPFAKSLSTLIGVAGQLYVAIIISMLVGKYSSSSGSSNQ